MTEELSYIPYEIVNIIAHFTEGIAGLAFIQTSKTYNKTLNKNKITYFKQCQLEKINKIETIIINGKQYYGNNSKFYCYDCSCLLVKKDSIKTHVLKCRKNKPLICEHCDSPKPFHQITKKNLKECIFQTFSCHYCRNTYHYVEHDSNNCPDKYILCLHCDKEYKSKEISTHNCNFLCYKCNEKIDYQNLYSHQHTTCPEQRIRCSDCHSSYTKKYKAYHDRNCRPEM